MKPVSNKNKIERLVTNIADKRFALFQINALTRKGREELMAVLSSVFKHFNLNDGILFQLFSAVVEIIFNAIKANVKFLLFKEHLKEKLRLKAEADEIEEILEVILKEEPLLDFIERYVVKEKIKHQTRLILTWDESLRARRNDLSESQKKQVIEFRKKLASEELQVHFTIALGENNLVFTVVNDSPILPDDLDRITSSRQVHHKLYKENKSTEFFRAQYLDQTESAGYGIALADEVFYDLGLDALKQFTIQSKEQKTFAVLRIPLQSLTD